MGTRNSEIWLFDDVSKIVKAEIFDCFYRWILFYSSYLKCGWEQHVYKNNRPQEIQCQKNSVFQPTRIVRKQECVHCDKGNLLKGIEKKNVRKEVIQPKPIYRDWSSKFVTVLNMIIGCSSKSEWSNCPFAKMIPSWENHFGKITAWSVIYFLIYSLLSYLAQLQILVISL